MFLNYYLIDNEDIKLKGDTSTIFHKLFSLNIPYIITDKNLVIDGKQYMVFKCPMLQYWNGKKQLIPLLEALCIQHNVKRNIFNGCEHWSVNSNGEIFDSMANFMGEFVKLDIEWLRKVAE